MKWIEAVLDEKLPEGDFADVLQNGVVLCRLMNKIQPESVKKIKEKVDMMLVKLRGLILISRDPPFC